MIKIIEQTDSWLMINKPGGVSVHNDSSSVIDYFKSKGTLTAPVHRIDKETSGLLLLSKNQNDTAKLQAALADSKKSYLAICRGKLDQDEGVWKDQLSDKAEGYKNPKGKKSELKDCMTSWKKLTSNNYFTLILFQISTGRTHQIRKHCALHKLEILGDKRYGDSKYRKLIASKYSFTGMALHSYKLDITLDEKERSFVAELPEYFEKLMGDSLEEHL